MSALLVQVRHQSGQTDQVVVDAERVLIGSGAHCDIRLPTDQASLEHVALQGSEGGVYVQALAFDPPPTVNGVPFTQGPLANGSVLAIGNVQITVSVTEAAATTQKKKQETSPVTVIALLGILVGAYLTFFVEEEQPKEGPPREAPPLFAAPVTTCPQQGPRELLLALGRERLALADTKRERRPFYIQDGIQAVPVYEQAAACFRLAGEQQAANEAAGAAEVLRRELDTDYRTHRVRLEHFLGVADFVAARREVRTLLQLTEGKQDDYVTWLTNLDRKLKRKLGRPES